MYHEKELFRMLMNGEMKFISTADLQWTGRHETIHANAVRIDKKVHPCTHWAGNAGTSNITIHYEIEYDATQKMWLKNGVALNPTPVETL